MAGPVALVGRDGELSRLMETLCGDTRLVLIAGDAGVGKTRFVAEAVVRASAAGMLMIRGECLPLTGMLPLLPVTSALDDLARREGGRFIEAALAASPGFVRAEVGRLVPRLAQGDTGPEMAGPGEGWLRGRLFAGVAELLDAAASGSSGLGLLVEDVHWADGETLDFLTFLGRAGRPGAVRVIVTCRSDETPLGDGVAAWLARVRGAAAVQEIRLGPLTRSEVAEHVACLAGGPVSDATRDELFTRAEGNPFFTEQLVAAALADRTADGGMRMPAALPERLADVLATRADRCAGNARTLLNALAVLGRPAAEDLLAAVTRLGIAAVRDGLRELAEARLLADAPSGALPGDLAGSHRLRHALLAEAVTGALPPWQQAALHERIAQVLGAAGDDKLAGEAAGHWQAAGHAGAELPARVAAGRAAERVYGYAEAAMHWRRAIEIWRQVTDAARVAGIGLPLVYLHAIDALFWSGDSMGAGEFAERAYRRFGRVRDPVTAATACHRAAFFRATDSPDASRELMAEALRLFELAPPSQEHAAARLDYALSFRDSAERGSQPDIAALLNRTLEVAEAAGAQALTARAVTGLAREAFLKGRVDEGLILLDRGRDLAHASCDGVAQLRHDITESDMLIKLARFRQAAEIALRGIEAARHGGLEASWQATQLAWYGAKALLALGRTTAAEALTRPLTTGPPELDRWLVHDARAEIDLLRGDTDAASRRRQQIRLCTGDFRLAELADEAALRAAELYLWTAAPGEALAEIRRVLGAYHAPDESIFCGRLLATGMRACADLAGQARARRDPLAAKDAIAAADELAGWVAEADGAPFADHPSAVAIPAERAIWEAERTRLSGENDPEAWAVAAKTWDGLCCPHRAGYAWWRQSQAQLDVGQPATAVTATLREAATAADGHEPLRAQVGALAERARITLRDTPGARHPAEPLARYGLTARELAVLRLLAAGRTNTQIGAELYISQRTAGVHVTNILRKLGVSGRVQAAALAERAGLLDA